MLNPSTADAEYDDPTIRRCIGFAKLHGYGGLEVWNLFAFRATKPADLFKAANKVGTQGCSTYWAAVPPGSAVVLAWGANARDSVVDNRAREVVAVLALRGLPLYTLGLTADGIPRHPLYLRADAPLQPYRTNVFPEGAGKCGQ